MSTTTTTATTSEVEETEMNPPPTETMMMDCIVYGSERGTVEKVSRPKLTKAEPRMVLVQVYAAGLNSVDAKEVIGDKLPTNPPPLYRLARSKVIQDKIIGFDFSGVVVTTSCGFEKGDQVFGCVAAFQGTLAEYIQVPFDQLWKMPKYYYADGKTRQDKRSLSFVQAAAMPMVCLTVLQCFQSHEEATIPTTEEDLSVLIIGASGTVGHVAIQMARDCFRASHITAVCSLANVEFCIQQGATHVIPYDDQVDEICLFSAFQRAPGVRFDIVLDCVTTTTSNNNNNNKNKEAQQQQQQQQDATTNTTTTTPLNNNNNFIDSIHYPTLLQRNNASIKVLSDNYMYRRLGGPTEDRIRAWTERVSGWKFWTNAHEKLILTQVAQCSPQLQQLQIWMQDYGYLQPPYIEPTEDDDGGSNGPTYKTYEFTKEGVEQAFADILSRKVRGKVVVQIQKNETV